MVQGLLFKWEDSAALKHHCGFCDRPLNHPGARASCFGKHSEPCIRYHQAMFMRLRGHTCTYCVTIDEAHYKRHIDIAEKIRCLYESCGEVDWTIKPPEPDGRVRISAHGRQLAVAKDSDSNFISARDDSPTSRRQRKDAKSLARAASRSRVITHEEIQYVDSVLHITDASGDSDGPRNLDEIDEIERHLRYHAQVYNTNPDKHTLGSPQQFPDTGVNFDVEMDRILETFFITELIKRNRGNCGLQRRVLKKFDTFVEDFKRAVIEDLVLVKKDVLEVRMRRAGYMRYTTKTAVSRVEDRYIDKDWKTGERLHSDASDSSGAISMHEETHSEYREPTPSKPHGFPRVHIPDRRHLMNIHKRVSGDDGLNETIIEPYCAPLLPLLPDPAPSKKTRSLKVILGDYPNYVLGTNKSTSMEINSSQGRSDAWKTDEGYPETAASDSVPLNTAPLNMVFSHLPMPNDIANKNRSVGAPAVKAPAKVAISTSRTPEQFVGYTESPEPKLMNSHPIVTQKKKAKREREAKRKAKKLTVQEEAPSSLISVASLGPVASESAVSKSIANSIDHDMALQNRLMLECPETDQANVEPHPQISNSSFLDKDASSKVQAVSENADLALVRLDHSAQSATLLVTNSNKHAHWLRFTRHLLVDQVTTPCMITSFCPFERKGDPDCPFHETVFDRKSSCPCCAFRKHMCHLVYPGKQECSFGPLDRFHCERLLAMYEKDTRTKGRLMILDDIIYDYLIPSTSDSSNNHMTESMPKPLAQEYMDCFEKSKGAGTLMQQQHLFQRLSVKNKLVSHPFSKQILYKMQAAFEPKNGTYTCYCYAGVTKGGISEDVIVCSYSDCRFPYFHKSCVEKRHPENVTRWYCMVCSQRMKNLASKTLHASATNNIIDKVYICDYQEHVLKEVMNIPEEMFENIKKRVGNRLSLM